MDYNILLSKRLKIILDRYYQGNFSAMAKDIGVTDTGIGSYIRGKKDKNGNIRISTPSAEVIAAIVNNLGINSEWLLFGTGEMLKEEVIKEQDNNQERLLDIIEAQLVTIKNQSESIKQLTQRIGIEGEI